MWDVGEGNTDLIEQRKVPLLFLPLILTIGHVEYERKYKKFFNYF